MNSTITKAGGRQTACSGELSRPTGAGVVATMLKSGRHLSTVSCVIALLLFANGAVAQNDQGTPSSTPAAQLSAVPTEAPAATAPDQPSWPPTPEQMPPNPPKVSYEGGKLTIEAFNSTLAAILTKVAALTGAEIDVPASASRERMAAQLGPGPARKVLASLLIGTNFDYLIRSSDVDPQDVRSVLLTPRATKSSATSAVAAAPHPSRSPYARPPVETTATAEPEPAAEIPVPVPVAVAVPAQPESAAATTAEPISPDPPPAVVAREVNSPQTSPLAPPASKTPESMAQQLQQMYQQRQQQMESLKGIQAAQRNP